MAYILKKVGDRANIPYQVIECDTAQDQQSLNIATIPMGSRCYVIENGKWYALNSSKSWVEVPSSGAQPDPDAVYDGGVEE